MRKKKERTNFEFFLNQSIIFLAIFMISIITLTILDKFVSEEQEFNMWCNNEFGHNNWTLIDITATEECQNFTGNCWHCVAKE